MHFCALAHSSTFSSVQFSCSVVSDSLQPHESQHTRPPCPLPTPGVHSNSCALSRWCHPAISSWVVSFSSCPQSLPASGSFPMSQLFTWGGQSTGVLALALFLPWTPRADLLQNGLVGSPCSPRDCQEPSAHFSSVTQSCLTLCDPMNHSTPGLPVHHQLPEFTQTHVHIPHIPSPSWYLQILKPIPSFSLHVKFYDSWCYYPTT